MRRDNVLHNQTIDGLHALRLPAMAAGFAEQAESANYEGLSFTERLGLLVDRELTERENRRLVRYRKSAKLRADAVIEDIDFRRQRGLDRSTVMGLAEGSWVRNHHTVGIVGPTGVGKTFLACALANAAISRGHGALYMRSSRMLDELAIARLDGRLARLSATWARIDVLVIDDFLLRPLTTDQAADVLEIIEDRAGLRATIFTAQLPIAMWHEALGEPTIADAIMDRLLANLHRIELDGESMRQPASPSTREARAKARTKKQSGASAPSDTEVTADAQHEAGSPS
jgi:DNA replication protein DnaC